MAFVVGTVVTVVSSILPARRAARVAPVEALRESADTGAGGSLHRRLVVGLIVTGLGVAALLYGLFGNQSNAGALIGLGAAVTFVGIAILLPLGGRPLAGGDRCARSAGWGSRASSGVRTRCGTRVAPPRRPPR